jgi:hypothetical protein
VTKEQDVNTAIRVDIKRGAESDTQDECALVKGSVEDFYSCQSSHQLQDDFKDVENASNGESNDHADVRSTTKAEHETTSNPDVSADVESL